ncbi:hypothetical protein AMJ80_09800 [bacterium SM23_31]|nr:MAG: hypothetical protein AMJ80_09800 [bacterium SM23_31]
MTALLNHKDTEFFTSRIMMYIFLFSFILLHIHDLNAQIIINEVMFNPAGNENHNEFVELYNAGSSAVDLSGWLISDSSGSDIIIDAGSGTILQPGQYGIVLDPDYFINSTLYDSIIPPEALILTIDGPTIGSRGLSNSTPELISIVSSAGDTITAYRYSTDNNDGFSDEKIIPGDVNEDYNWGNSTVYLGTPGARNSITPPDFDMRLTSLTIVPTAPFINQTVTMSASVQNHGISPPETAELAFYIDSDKNGVLTQDEILNEIVLNLSDFNEFGDSAVIDFAWQPPYAGNISIWVSVNSMPDSNMQNNMLSFLMNVLESENQVIINEIMYQPLRNEAEWIELFNRGTSEVNLRNWRIKDKSRAEGAVIGQGDIIFPPGDYIVLTGDSIKLANYYPLSFTIINVSHFPALNNDGDEITVLDAAGRVSDSVEYNSSWGSNPGVSLERIQVNASSNDRNNWGLSTSHEGATPGHVNSLEVHGISGQVLIVPEPNPFSPGRDMHVCRITVTQPLTQSLVTMKIFDRYGRLVRDLLRGEPQGSNFTVEWDGRNNNGRLMQTDIYVIYFNAISTNSGRSIEHKTTVVLVNER